MAARVAVAGLGLIGKAHVRRVLECPEAELAGIVEPREDARAEAGRLGVPWFADLEGLLASARPDGIILATPTSLHLSGALACIESGIAVLVEKPIADKAEDARRLVEAASRYRVPVLVGHHRRHSPLLARARSIVSSGALGRITAVNGRCWFKKPSSYFDAGPWRKELGGGVVLINLIHVVDDLRCICGDVTSVRAITSNGTRHFPVEDTAAILLRFASGALGTLSATDSAAAPWSWELTSGENKAYPNTHQSCYFIGGTEGSLSVPDLGLWRHESDAAWFGPIAAARTIVPEVDPLAAQMLHFCAVIRREAEPLVSAEEGARTLEATLAILTSASRGSAVELF
jgi:predicted dehydrogenase